MSINLPPEYFQFEKCLDSNLVPQTCDFNKNVFKKSTIGITKQFILTNDSQTMCFNHTGGFVKVNPNCRIFKSDNFTEGKIKYDYLTQGVNSLLSGEKFIKYNYLNEGEKNKDYIPQESGIHIGTLGKGTNTSYTQLNVLPYSGNVAVGSLLQN